MRERSTFVAAVVLLLVGLFAMSLTIRALVPRGQGDSPTAGRYRPAQEVVSRRLSTAEAAGVAAKGRVGPLSIPSPDLPGVPLGDRVSVIGCQGLAEDTQVRLFTRSGVSR